MATLMNVNGTFYLQFYAKNRKPTKKTVSLKTKLKKRALRLKVDLEDRFIAGDYDPWVNPDWHQADVAPQKGLLSLGEAINGFLERKQHLAPSTRKNYAEILHRFQLYAGKGTKVDCVTADQVKAWLDAYGSNDVSRKTYVRHLSVFFNDLVKRGEAQANPCKEVGLKKVPSKFPKYLTAEEVGRLISAIEDYTRTKDCLRIGEVVWLIPVIKANAYLGLRVGELCNLKWSDVDLKRRCLTVRNRDGFSTKSGKDRVVPIADAPLRVLVELWQAKGEGPYVFQSPKGQLDRIHVGRLFKKFVRLAGLSEKVRFHSLRHTACSWLATKGVSIV